MARTSPADRQRYPLRSLAVEITDKAYDDAVNGREVDWRGVRKWASITEGISIAAIRRAAQEQRETEHDKYRGNDEG